MLTPLTASETLDRARKALQSGRGAGLPELLKLIESLSTNLAATTITEIAELIEKDAAVLSRVLTVANTLMHNPRVEPMASIPQAIHQLGFHRVRSLAVSLMLIGNAGGANSTEQREAAAQALCAGLLAQGCAQNLGSLDPDLAFACAALRQFGAIILPAVSLPLCQEVRRRRQGPAATDAAYRKFFGVTPIELSRRLLSTSKLPEEVMQTLRDCQPESLGGTAASTYGSKLLGVADYGARLASITLDASSTHEIFNERSHSLARKFEKLLPGVSDTLEASLLYTDERISTFTRGGGGTSFSVPGLHTIRARVLAKNPFDPDAAARELNAPFVPPTIIDPDAPVEPAATIAPPSPEVDTGAIGEPVASCPPVTPPSDATEPRPAPAAPEEKPRDVPSNSSALASTKENSRPAPVTAPAPAQPPEWKTALAQSAAFETQAVAPTATVPPWITALTFARDSLGAQLAWKFTPTPGGKTLTLDHGIGPHWQEVARRAVLRPEERTVFGVCLTQRENVVIHNSGETNLVNYLPDWFRTSPVPPPGAFILLPLLKDKRAVGLVLIGWEKSQRLTVTAAQTEIVRQVFASTGAA